MPVVVISRTQVAARLLRYTEKEKAGQVEPRVLFAEGIRCRVPTATQEFRALRLKHGTEGKLRKIPDRYELPSPGEVATHVRHIRPSGRGVWIPAPSGQDATHVRRPGVGTVHTAKVVEDERGVWNYYPEAKLGDEGKYLLVGGHAYVRESEAVQLIVSFGLDEVNPRDLEQVRQGFEFTRAMVGELYPGVQAKLVGQADGTGMVDSDKTALTEGGKFHVHVVMNATVAEAMELDGQVWEAGRKLSGPWTDIDRVRDRIDQYIDDHGAAYGIIRNQVPVAEQLADRRGVMDRRMAARAAVKGTELSRSDRLREAWWAAIEDDQVTDLATFKDAMAAQGVTVTEPGWRRGKPPKVLRLSYALDGVTTRGQSLGDRYDYPAVVETLDEKLATGVIPTRPTRAKAGPPKPVRAMDDVEADQARRIAEQMTREAQLREWIEEQAAEASVSVPEFVSQWGDSMLDQQTRAKMLQAMEDHQRELAEREREQERRTEEYWRSGGDPDYWRRSEAEVLAPEVAEAPEAAEPEPTQPRFDEASWVENPPTKPTETFIEAGNRGAPVDEVLALGDAWDEWRAYEKSEAYAEHQRAAEEARRAEAQTAAEAAAKVVEEPAVVEQPRVEVVEADPRPSATAPARGRRPFLSALRQRQAKSVKGQQRIVELAEFDETSRARLLTGKRLLEGDVKAAGIGPRTLEAYGQDFCDPVVEQLDLRSTKQAAAKAAFEEGTVAGQAVAERLREEIALGVYEDLSSVVLSLRNNTIEIARDELAAEFAEREDRDRGG